VVQRRPTCGALALPNSRETRLCPCREDNAVTGAVFINAGVRNFAVELGGRPGNARQRSRPASRTARRRVVSTMAGGHECDGCWTGHGAVWYSAVSIQILREQPRWDIMCASSTRGRTSITVAPRGSARRTPARRSRPRRTPQTIWLQTFPGPDPAGPMHDAFGIAHRFRTGRSTPRRRIMIESDAPSRRLPPPRARRHRRPASARAADGAGRASCMVDDQLPARAANTSGQRSSLPHPAVRHHLTTRLVAQPRRASRRCAPAAIAVEPARGCAARETDLRAKVRAHHTRPMNPYVRS
jgi:hypothetical protein